MDIIVLDCQVCVTKYKRIYDFKKHLHSEQHKTKMKEIFQEDMLGGDGFFPFIAMIDPQRRKEFKQPIIGLSLLTLCFSTTTNISFYLCHVCEEKCPSDRLAYHLSTANHCSNYFNYTDPNALRFSWLPGKNKKAILTPQFIKEANERGARQLQMLNLPESLLKGHKSMTYSQVMCTLSENDKLLKLIEAVKPNRMMIQTYQRGSNRKHPLLGMHHLIECICVGQPEKRHYLCTLCNLTLATHMIIKHVLSFDHIFSYFRAWHPSTLLSRECYMEYEESFASMMLDFAKQAEEIHGTAHANMKQVNLEPAKFTSVNFTCYAEAMKELESITKENKEDSLIPVVEPGKKLVRRFVSEYKLFCQNCSSTFENMATYYKHLSNSRHKQMMKYFFGEEEPDGYYQTGWRPTVGLYQHLKKCRKQNQQVVGLSLVVACANTQMSPFYLCFACQECFEESFLVHHFNSRKHLINTLLYQNPWRLPFAWEDHLDVKFLRSMALEEERDRGPDQMMLKVLDIPSFMFRHLIQRTYREVMSSLEGQHTLLKRQVPTCETYSKLKQNKRFPLLGQEFIVMHNICDQHHQVNKVGFLCLLCERRSLDKDWYAHVFSREHVTVFLHHFHPGSLSSGTDAETLLDLAGSAALDHPISHVQEIKLFKPIWEPCNYWTAKSILASAKRRAGKGELELPIIPKGKLVSTEMLKNVDKGHVTENSPTNSQMMEKQTSQQSTDNSETILKKIKAEVGAETTHNHCAERGENAEKGDNKDTPSEKESEKIKAEVSSETCLVMKEEKIEEPAFRNPSGESPDTDCQNTDKSGGTETEEKTSISITDGLTQIEDYKSTENERKRSRSMSEKSQEDTCPNVDEKEEMGHKRQRLTSKQDASCEEPQNLPAREEVTAAAEAERHKTAMNTGLVPLLECHCDQHDPIYLCECCPVKNPEKDVLSHVTRAEHQVHLDEEVCNNVSEQSFESAIQEVKAVEAPQDCFSEPALTSALSAVQPVDTSVTLHAQHEVYSGTDDFQVVDMELDDDSKDPETQPSSVIAAGSVMTETTGEGPPESNQDVKKIQVKVPESAGNADTCLTVSRSSEAASSVHMSTRGTSTTRLHPDSTGKDVKAEIISNTTVGPLDIATTCGVDTSQYAATTVSPVATSTKSTTAISQYPACPSNSTSHTIKSTTLISSLRATTSSCTTTTPTTTTTNAPAAITKQKVVYPKSSTTSQIENCSKYSGTTRGTNTTCLHPDSTGNDVKAEIISNETVGSFDMATTCKRVETSQYAATTVSPVTTSSKSTTDMSKYPAHPSNSTSLTIKSTAPISSLRATTSSCTTPTPTNAPATITKQNVVYPKSSTTSQIEKCSKYSEPASQTMVTVVHCGNTQARSVKSENKNPSKEPSHTSTSKTKPREKIPKVGLDQLIVVSCEEKQQVYCQLCTVRLSGSSHITSFGHKFKYVKMRFPGLTTEMSEFESKLEETVCRLANDEKDRKAMTTQVKVEVYKELEALSARKAIERLQAMMRQKDSQGSSSTADSTQILRLQAALTSPCEASSPDDEVKMESPQGYAECARFAQIPDTCQDMAETREQLEMSDQKFEDTQKALEDCQKTSPVESLNLDLLPSAASVRMEQQSQSRPKSYLSLMVKGPNSQPVIGLGCVWECRGESLELFYLCEICREMLSISDICEHMVSVKHRCQYLEMRRYKWYQMFWLQEDLDLRCKMEILQGVAQMISEQERYDEMDAQVVLLKQDSFKHIQTAAFSKALESVQSIKKEPQVTCLPVCTLQQKDLQPEDRLRREESFPTEKQSTQALGTDQRSDNDKCLPTRKRPAATPLETLVRPCINNPQHQGPLPAKGSNRPLQPSTESASESSPDNPAATSTLLPPKDKDAGPGSVKQDTSIENNMAHQLVQLALMMKRQRSVNTQGVFGNVSQFKPGPVQNIIHRPGLIAQPQSQAETDSPSGDQFSINTIVTTRPDRQFRY